MTSTFDARAANWDENAERVKRARLDAEAIAGAIDRRGLRAMELGCGTATTALALGDLWSEIVLCDSSGGMLEAARAKVKAAGRDGVSYLQSDIINGPLPEGGFDLVYSTMVLHHVEDPAALFARVAPLLAPGGRLAVIDLDAEDGSFHTRDAVPHNGFERADLEPGLNAAGLKIESWRTCANFDRAWREYTRFLMIATAAS